MCCSLIPCCHHGFFCSRYGCTNLVRIFASCDCVGPPPRHLQGLLWKPSQFRRSTPIIYRSLFMHPLGVSLPASGRLAFVGSPLDRDLGTKCWPLRGKASGSSYEQHRAIPQDQPPVGCVRSGHPWSTNATRKLTQCGQGLFTGFWCETGDNMWLWDGRVANWGLLHRHSYMGVRMLICSPVHGQRGTWAPPRHLPASQTPLEGTAKWRIHNQSLLIQCGCRNPRW